MSLMDFLKSRRIIPIGLRRISKLGYNRYVIYLPIELNYLWTELNQSRTRIKVYIEIEE